MHTDVLAMMAATLVAGSITGPHRPLTTAEAIDMAVLIYAQAEVRADVIARTGPAEHAESTE